VARKPETKFKDGVHIQMPSKDVVHRQSMYTPYANGTPDHYYEALFHLWVEYKFLDVIPLKGVLVSRLLSAQQLLWALRALANNQPWACIIGVGRDRDVRGIICQDTQALVTRESVSKTKKEVAAWICLSVGVLNHRSPVSSSPKKSRARSVSRTKCQLTVTDSPPQRVSVELSFEQTPIHHAVGATPSAGTINTATYVARKKKD